MIEPSIENCLRGDASLNTQTRAPTRCNTQSCFSQITERSWTMSALFSSVLQTIQHSNPHRVASWVLTASFVFSCLFCLFKDAYQEAATTLFSQLEPLMKQLDASYLFVYEVCLPVCSFFLVSIVVCLTIYAVMEEAKLFTKVSSENSEICILCSPPI